MYAGTVGAVQLQRPGAPLLHAPRRQRGRRAGEPAAQGRARPAEPRHRGGGAARGGFDRAAATAPARRSPRSRPARRCSRRWWPRSTPPTTATRLAAADAGARRSWSRRRAWWTWTGPSRRRRPSGSFRVDRVRAAEAGVSVEQVTQVLTWRCRAPPAGLASVPTAREGVAIVPRLGARQSEQRRGAARGAGGHAARPDAAGAVRHGGIHHACAAPDAEEPAPRHLRDRRRGRHASSRRCTPSSR